MKIPKRFKLHGRVIEVEYDNNLVSKDDNLGLASYRTDKIVLQSSTDGRKIPEKQLEETFCHELVHWLLHTSGQREQDERVIDVLGGLLHQAITTMEYDESQS